MMRQVQLPSCTSSLSMPVPVPSGSSQSPRARPQAQAHARKLRQVGPAKPDDHSNVGRVGEQKQKVDADLVMDHLARATLFEKLSPRVLLSSLVVGVHHHEGAALGREPHSPRRNDHGTQEAQVK